MSLHYLEKIESRNGDLSALTLEVSYTVWGDNPEDDEIDTVIMGARGASPAFVDVEGARLWRQNILWVPTGHLMWDVRVPYERKKKEEGSVRFNFDTTGGTATLKCAKEHIQSYPAPGRTARNHHGAIGVTKDAVEGVEIVVPALKVSFSFTNPQGVVTMTYAKQLARYTGYINDNPFRTFARGELLFIGASGSDGSDAPAEVTYNMIASQDATGLTFGDIVGVAKPGHAAAWVEFRNKPEDGQATTQPECAHIERVYDYVDFESVFGWS